MQVLFDYVRDNPWLWVLFLFGMGVWIGALIVIFRSPKFLRKWLWVLLTFFSFGFSWSINDNATIGIGFPVGALYVLWFWLYGKSPTPEEIQKHKVALAPPPYAAAGRKPLQLQITYLVATAAMVVFSWLVFSGELLRSFLGAVQDSAHGPPPFPSELLSAMEYGQDVFATLMVALFIFLSFRPYWWGKIICFWAGIAWSGFALTSVFFPGIQPTPIYIVLGCGLTMITAGAAHQKIDPRFGGTYLR